MCEFLPSAFQRLLGEFVVQRTWSNASVAAGHDPCVPAPATPYVAAAPVFDDITLTTHSGNTINTKGVMVPVGTSKTIEVDLFSDQPTDADFIVQAQDGASVTGTGTPSLSFQWDRTQGKNGDKLHLMITRTLAASGRGSGVLLTTKVNGQAVSLW